MVIGLSSTNQEPDRFPCSICGATFTHKTNLRRHMRNHTGNYKHFCDKCRRGFYMKYLYDEHVMVVHEGRKFYCDYCGKGFNSKGMRNVHLKKDHEKYEK